MSNQNFSLSTLTNNAAGLSQPGTYPVHAEIEPAAAASSLPLEIYRYLLRKKSKGLTQGTLEQYFIVLNALNSHITTPLSEITDWDILEFLDTYEQTHNISPRRKESMRIILNGFFRYETDLGNLKRNPMCTIDSIKYRKTTRIPLTDIELELLRSSCSHLRDKALLEFLFATGCRVSEVITLNKIDINISSRSVKVLGKGNKERIVFLNAASIVSLQSYFNSREDTNEALFVSIRKPHNRLSKAGIEHAIKTLGERAGINRRVYPHLIRHTTATYLLNHGMNLEEVQSILGHESVDTTRIYAKSDTTLLMNSYRRSMT